MSKPKYSIGQKVFFSKDRDNILWGEITSISVKEQYHDDNTKTKTIEYRINRPTTGAFSGVRENEMHTEHKKLVNRFVNNYRKELEKKANSEFIFSQKNEVDKNLAPPVGIL